MQNVRFLRSARRNSLMGIQNAIEAGDSGAAIRCKALKALSEFAQADQNILSIPSVSNCFGKALKARSLYIVSSMIRYVKLQESFFMHSRGPADSTMSLTSNFGFCSYWNRSEPRVALNLYSLC